jgi:predicted DNA-binding protein YlxM (UPF0122 family)
MKQHREEWLNNLTDEEKEKLTHKDFSRSELTEILDDMVMSKELRECAELFYIEDLNISQVADKVQINWQTSQNMKKSLDKLVIFYLKRQYKKKPKLTPNKPINIYA